MVNMLQIMSRSPMAFPPVEKHFFHAFDLMYIFLPMVSIETTGSWPCWI